MLKELSDSIRKALLFVHAKIAPDGLFGPISDVFSRGVRGTSRALLIYRTLPFHLKASHPAFNFHQSLAQSLIVAKVLDDAGFVVDVMDYSQPRAFDGPDYDLVISHDCGEHPKAWGYRQAKKIYLASGTEHREHNLRQRARVEAFEKRMGHHEVELVWDREDMPWVEECDAIFCFGNRAVAETWERRFSCPVFSFQNTALASLSDLARDWDRERRHFLFLGSRQQLAKGLDLLLEAFSANPGLHLHVCGHYLRDKGFCNAYNKALFRTPNIHSHGWVDVSGSKFRKIAAACAFTVSATCAEGSPGSITNAMRLGLIPILSREAGLDAGEGVLLFADTTIAGISDFLRRCSEMSVGELAEISGDAVTRARRDFNEAGFAQRWKEMVAEVIGMP